MRRAPGRQVAVVVVIIVVAVSGAATALALAGFGTNGITAARLDQSISRAFSNLFVVYQVDEGYPLGGTPKSAAQARCYKGSPTSLQSGAGNDWVCTIRYAVVPLVGPFEASYNVDVQTDGCYAGDGDGPTSLNTSKEIVGPDGRQVLNPLWLIDGCFDITASPH